MSQTCPRCGRIVHRACQSDTETLDCSELRKARAKRRLSNQPPRDIAAELRAEIKRLRDDARLRAIQRCKAPLTQRNFKQRLRVHAQVEAEELAKRQPQIAWLERKLARLEG